MNEAYQSGKKIFTKNFQIIPEDRVPIDAYVINSHVIYKVKKGMLIHLNRRVELHHAGTKIV